MSIHLEAVYAGSFQFRRISQEILAKAKADGV